MSIKHIIIFGGGTSGWLSAAYILNNMRVPVKVTLIEDTTLGPIGVGEGTQPGTARFLYSCGLQPKKWMKDSNASFKLGVELVGWNDQPYFVDNDTFRHHQITPHIFSTHYFVDKSPKEFSDWHPAYQLAKHNKSPKMEGEFDAAFDLPIDSYGAVHFSAFDIIKTIKEHILHKITYIDTKIINVKHNDTGVTSLVSESAEEYSADLYLDCSGFKSILLEQTLGVKFESYKEWLPCDKAIAIPTQYANPKEECFPYTKATAMSSGWRWTIPIFNRIGNGYVYSSNFISDEDAEEELRDSIGDYTTPANRLTMKCGRHELVAYKNVCAIGLSAGFVEPLEATGITFTTDTIKNLVAIFNDRGNIWDNFAKEIINKYFYEMVTEILAFVWIHYHYSSKNDTDFWKAIRKQRIEDLPKDAQYFIDSHLNNVPNFALFSRKSMFNSAHWFSILKANNAYSIKTPLNENELKYAKYFIDLQSKRIELAKETFPNLYDYLSEWYK